MDTLKIVYVDGGDNFESYVEMALRKRYNIIRCYHPEDNPDLVICSTFLTNGGEHRRYRKFKRLWITGENDYPDFNEYDYAVSCHDIKYTDRHCRIPFFTFRLQLPYLQRGDNFKELDAHDPSTYLNRKFCSAVISNTGCADPDREKYFRIFNNWKGVDSAGKAFNNMGCLDNIVTNVSSANVHNVVKHSFISQYKFNLAFENCISEGYVTEKIIDAFAANTIPIYYGTHDVVKEFNPDSFIAVTDFNTPDELLNRINEINSNNELYMKILSSSKLNCPDYLSIFEDYLWHVTSSPTHERQYGYIKLKVH